MNAIKFTLLLSVLFSFNITTPVALSEQQKTALAITACISTYNAYKYIRYTYCDRPEEFYVQYSYPYAQLWYEDMIVQYPQAHLDTKRFLQIEHGTSAEQIVWSMSCNNIYCPQVDLAYINDAYKKKIDGEELDDTTIKTLYMCEWLLLHEAGHVELNYHLNKMFLTIGVVATFEFIKMLYKESTDDACNKSIESFFSAYITTDATNKSLTNAVMWMRYIVMTYSELITIGCIQLMWVRDQESQADSFANKHADTHSLPGAISFFEYILSLNQDNIEALTHEIEADEDAMSLLSYFNTTAQDFADEFINFITDPLHPSVNNRIQSVRDEIEHRLQNQAVTE